MCFRERDAGKHEIRRMGANGLKELVIIAEDAAHAVDAAVREAAKSHKVVKQAKRLGEKTSHIMVKRY